jgi:hypothetical protein
MSPHVRLCDSKPIGRPISPRPISPTFAPGSMVLVVPKLAPGPICAPGPIVVFGESLDTEFLLGNSLALRRPAPRQKLFSGAMIVAESAGLLLLS